jgi:hypothetical protein
MLYLVESFQVCRWTEIGTNRTRELLELNSNQLRHLRGFFNLVCEAIGTAATPGLLCQPRVIVKMMIVEKQMECRLAGETTKVLRENLPQCHFCPSQNPT